MLQLNKYLKNTHKILKRSLQLIQQNALTTTTTAATFEKDQTQDIVDFEKQIINRRVQAKRTALIQIINNIESNQKTLEETQLTKLFYELNEILLKRFRIGIQTVNHYLNEHNHKDYALVEFTNENDLNFILNKETAHFKVARIPIKTRILCLHTRHFERTLAKSKVPSSMNFDLSLNQDLTLTYNIDKLLNDQSSTLNDQIVTLFKQTKQNDFLIRLKFFFASIIEDLLKLPFQNAICLPFGSTLNGFGTLKSDLDLSIDFKNLYDFDNRYASGSGNQPTPQHEHQNLFYYRSKITDINNLELSKRQLDLISYLMHDHLPDFGNIEFLRNARVPIIKGSFKAIDPNLKFDISNTTHSIAYLMTKLLFIYSSLNKSITRPFINLIRLWTKVTKLSYIHDTTGIPINLTSYQITMLGLIFLIHKNRLPNITNVIQNYENLFKKSKQQQVVPQQQQQQQQKGIVNDFDENLINDDTDAVNHEDDATFDEELFEQIKFNNHRNLEVNLNKKKINLDELFIEFLKYYLNFDYKLWLRLDINNEIKANGGFGNRMYIENPFIFGVNVAKNMNERQLRRFLYACKQSIFIMENKRDGNIIKLFKKLNIPENVRYENLNYDYQTANDENNNNNSNTKMNIRDLF